MAIFAYRASARESCKNYQTFQTSVLSHEIGKVTEAIFSRRKTAEDGIVKMCKVELRNRLKSRDPFFVAAG
jgi:hypothetical protein